MRALEHCHCARPYVLQTSWRNQRSAKKAATHGWQMVGHKWWLPGSSKRGSEGTWTPKESQPRSQVTTTGHSRAADSKGRIHYQKQLINHKVRLKNMYVLLQIVALLLSLPVAQQFIAISNPTGPRYSWHFTTEIQAPAGIILCNTA